MSSSERDPDKDRVAKKKTPVDQPVEQSAEKKDIEADEIKKQIGPGLQTMYANVLNEELPDDLLAVVQAMASKQDKADSNAPPSEPAPKSESEGDADE